jgi:hypothetical protein
VKVVRDHQRGHPLPARRQISARNTGNHGPLQGLGFPDVVEAIFELQRAAIDRSGLGVCISCSHATTVGERGIPPRRIVRRGQRVRRGIPTCTRASSARAFRFVGGLFRRDARLQFFEPIEDDVVVGRR